MEKHNYELDTQSIEQLFIAIRLTNKRGNLRDKTDKEIIEFALYHYGGTIAQALVHLLFEQCI